jgi:hypothetical protein
MTVAPDINFPSDGVFAMPAGSFGAISVALVASACGIVSSWHIPPLNF